MTRKRRDGLLVLTVGASGSGKTAWVNRQTAKARRLLAWDIEGQHTAGAEVVRSRVRLAEIANDPGPGRYAYIPASVRDFDFWARCAFLWVRRAPGVVVAEELADVTTPGKAPDGWGMLVRRGRKYGADIYAITQRPAESDKTAVGNAAIIHCCRMSRAQDRRYMAAEMDLQEREIAGLKGLDWVEKDMRTGKVRRGTLRF